MITKQKFAEFLLSRFIGTNLADRFAILESLVLAEHDLQDLVLGSDCDRIEDLKEFSDWAQNLSEILFQEDFEIIELGDA